MIGVTYDAGMLIALERGDRRASSFHKAALRNSIAPIVPVGVLAQVWRGGPQTSLSRALAGCIVEELNEPQARAIGVACAKAKTSDIVDASVVLSAFRHGHLVATSDESDLSHIAQALGRELHVESI